MLLLTFVFAAMSSILGIGFHRKYRARLHSGASDMARYHRIGDYYGRPIMLAFEYRPDETKAPSVIEADVDEIYHYGGDYFLKGNSPGGKRKQVFKWDRISNPRVRYNGRNLDSLEALFVAAGEGWL